MNFSSTGFYGDELNSEILNHLSSNLFENPFSENPDSFIQEIYENITPRSLEKKEEFSYYHDQA